MSLIIKLYYFCLYNRDFIKIIRIDFLFLFQYLSNVSLVNISVSVDLQDITLTTTKTLDSGPSFVSANQGSSFGTLKPNETATFQGTYIIRQVDVDAGAIMVLRQS